MNKKDFKLKKKKADKRTIFIRVVAIVIAALMVLSVFGVLLSALF